jgi:hypothetical protein
VIGPWSSYAEPFLVGLGLTSVALLGLPLFFAPLAWARALRWPLPDDSRLTVYLGRCLGAVICVLAAFAFVAAGDPALQPFFFQIVIANFALMVVVHAWGAMRRIQPWTETAETFIWLGLLVAAILCYPAPP